ncbi:molybdopterin-synthase adenylyltransferase MoeB [Chitinophagaceae bacterium MMS25-I14]
MLSNEEQSRYSRHILLPEIGAEGQGKLKSAKVLVIGAGGLGCPVLQYLVAAGVGTIGIADGDNVDLSNLQRQILYGTNDTGNNKAETAAEKLQQLNAHTVFHVYGNIDAANALNIFKDYDIVVDGTDNFSSRYLINDACVISGRPLVFGAIYRFEGQVSVFNYNDGPTYRCLFPDVPADMPNCADIGVIATLPGIIGTMMANEVLKMITGAGAVLSGVLLTVDSLRMNIQQFRFNAVEKNKDIVRLTQALISCMSQPAAVISVSYDELRKMQLQENVQLLDIRDEQEHCEYNIGGINIPFYAFETATERLDPMRTTVIYCAFGQRGKQVASWLRTQGFRKVYHLEHGINGLAAQL